MPPAEKRAVGLDPLLPGGELVPRESARRRGPEARLVDASPTAIALRDLVCDIARSALFHHILTPSYNDAHRDHVHLDIKRGEKRWIIE